MTLTADRTRRGVLRAAGTLALGAFGGAARAAESLPAPASFADEVARALARRRALAVLASTPGCPWCLLVRRSYLEPLRREGQPVVEIDMASSAALRDFTGAPSTQARIAQGLGVRVAPTVLFLGAGGRELAPRIAGVPLPDFYGAYLEQRLEAANRAAG